MNTIIARYIVGLIAKDLDNRRPEGMKDCSSLELERIENLLKDTNSAKMVAIEKWIKDKLVVIGKNTVNFTPPVEGGDKAKFEDSKPPVEGNVKFAESILATINSAKTNNLKGIFIFVVPENIDTFKVCCRLSDNKDYRVRSVLTNNSTDTITIKL